MLETMSIEGFLKKEYVDMIINTDNEDKLLLALKEYKAPKHKW